MENQCFICENCDSNSQGLHCMILGCPYFMKKEKCLFFEPVFQFRIFTYKKSGNRKETFYKHSEEECKEIWESEVKKDYPAPTVWKFNYELKDYERMAGC